MQQQQESAIPCSDFKRKKNLRGSYIQTQAGGIACIAVIFFKIKLLILRRQMTASGSAAAAHLVAKAPFTNCSSARRDSALSRSPSNVLPARQCRGRHAIESDRGRRQCGEIINRRRFIVAGNDLHSGFRWGPQRFRLAAQAGRRKRGRSPPLGGLRRENGALASAFS